MCLRGIVTKKWGGGGGNSTIFLKTVIFLSITFSAFWKFYRGVKRYGVYRSVNELSCRQRASQLYALKSSSIADRITLLMYF